MAEPWRWVVEYAYPGSEVWVLHRESHRHPPYLFKFQSDAEDAAESYREAEHKARAVPLYRGEPSDG